MEKNLSYFMKRNSEPEIIEVPAPESYVDEKGNRLNLKIRKLSADVVQKINDSYKTRKIAINEKTGRPYSEGGEVLFIVDNNRSKALAHTIVEALVYPNLKDEELMKSYDCYDFTEMPSAVFSDISDYNYVAEVVIKACGIGGNANDDKEISDAKN